MSKATLIAPTPEGLVGKKTRKFHRKFPPLSLLISANLLRQNGWQVELFDLNAQPQLGTEAVIQSARNSDLVVVTTNPYADWQCPTFAIQSTLNLCQQLPSERLVLTGNHGTHYPGDMLRRTGARAVIREEPEFTLNQIAQRFAQGQTLDGLAGISYRHGDEVQHNTSCVLSHMDELPAPAYDLVNLQHYRYELLGTHFALLESSRGCPFSCNFCNLSMFQGGYRKRSPEAFIKELDALILEHGCRSMYIFDLEFTINRKMVKAVCEHLIEQDYANKYGFRWTCQTRADSVKDEILPLMKASGCDLIHFGVEAGDPEILKNTNKRIEKEAIRDGIERTRQHGIRTAAFFIFGHPNETEQHYRATLDFALELNPTFASFHPLLPFPGSPIFEERFGKGPYWDERLNLNLSYFTQEQEQVLSKWVQKAYRKFYLRPGYVKTWFNGGDWSMLANQLKLFKAFMFEG